MSADRTFAANVSWRFMATTGVSGQWGSRSSSPCQLHPWEIVWTKDTAALQYDIYVNDDQSECIVHER
jgi:hypothetical protein